MDSKLLKNQSRRIASSLLSLAILAGLAASAETATIRFSSPSLAWVLSPDGSQIIEIIGIAGSPRLGRAVPLPVVARRSWASPDAAAVLIQADRGLFLVRSPEQVELLSELPTGAPVSAVWDRASLGFAVCWETACESRSADGAIRARWEVAAGSRVIAYANGSGLLTVSDDHAEWSTGDSVIGLDSIPVAAAFRAGTKELWLLDATGRLTGRDAQGRSTGEAQLIPDAVGLVGALDGQSFFAADAHGAAALYSLQSQGTEETNLEEAVEGLWAGPGEFTVRLHESAKRPIGIWEAESRTTGWMPAAVLAPATVATKDEVR